MSVDINYYSFSPSRADKGFVNFIEDIIAVRKKYIKTDDKGPDESVILTDRQQDLFEHANLGYLIEDSSFNEELLILELKSIDLHYGSIENDGFDSGKDEMLYIEALVESFNLEIENEDNYPRLPTKKAWLQLFSTINQELLDKAINKLKEETGWEEKDCKSGLLFYLECARPVMVDLKDTKDSVFVRYYHNGGEAEPEAAEKLLLKRANEHMKKYNNLLTPVL
jgi:hypothetical protein